MAEVPLGTRPRPQQFPPRNRIISGLARAVVVVEGDVDSGALITAWYAAAQGRRVFAVPGSICAPTSRGPHRLLSRGARVVEDPHALLAALHVPPGKVFRRETGEPLEPAEARVLAVLEGQALHIDRVIERAGLSPSRVLGALAALEVRGLVRQFPGKNFARQPYGPGTERGPAGGVAWPNHSSS